MRPAKTRRLDFRGLQGLGSTREKAEMRANARTPVNIRDLDIPARARSALKCSNIETVDDLCRMSEAELLRSPNFGRVSLAAIKSALAQQGRALGEGEMENAGGQTGVVGVVECLYFRGRQSPSRDWIVRIEGVSGSGGLFAIYAKGAGNMPKKGDSVWWKDRVIWLPQGGEPKELDTSPQSCRAASAWRSEALMLLGHK